MGNLKTGFVHTVFFWLKENGVNTEKIIIKLNRKTLSATARSAGVWIVKGKTFTI